MVNEQIVISRGETSREFSFYTFGGDLVRQRNTGVVWLTDYTDVRRENVSRPKLERVRDDVYIALWEKWAPASHISTHALLFNEEGQHLTDIVDLGEHVRLQRGDETALMGDDVIWVTSNGTGLEITRLRVRSATR